MERKLLDEDLRFEYEILAALVCGVIVCLAAGQALRVAFRWIGLLLVLSMVCFLVLVLLQSGGRKVRGYAEVFCVGFFSVILISFLFFTNHVEEKKQTYAIFAGLVVLLFVFALAPFVRRMVPNTPKPAEWTMAAGFFLAGLATLFSISLSPQVQQILLVISGLAACGWGIYRLRRTGDGSWWIYGCDCLASGMAFYAGALLTAWIHLANGWQQDVIWHEIMVFLFTWSLIRASRFVGDCLYKRRAKREEELEEKQ